MNHPNSPKGFLVVIDGSGGVGSGTLAYRLAKHFSFTLLDSGLAYRAVASLYLETMRDEVELARNLTDQDLLRHDVRSHAVDQEVSRVAKIPAVREAVNDFLKKVIAQSEGCVIDGRDMAFVFPEAQVKLFLSAPVEVRAARRHKERQKRGEEVSYEEVLAALSARDAQDMEREASPFRKHPEAYEIDTEHLDADQVFEEAVKICEQVLV